MKSKIAYLFGALVLAFTVSACSSDPVKPHESQVPEMSTTMPEEITTNVSAEEKPVPVKKSDKTKKKSSKKKKST